MHQTALRESSSAAGDAEAFAVQNREKTYEAAGPALGRPVDVCIVFPDPLDVSAIVDRFRSSLGRTYRRNADGDFPYKTWHSTEPGRRVLCSVSKHRRQGCGREPRSH